MAGRRRVIQAYTLAAAALMPGGTFTPTDFSGLKIWRRADAGTLQTSGGSAAAADGDPVGQYLDQSGNGAHVAQATASKRGTLKLGVQAGKPGVRFDGVDDALRDGAYNAMNGATSYTHCFVYKCTNAAVGPILWGLAPDIAELQLDTARILLLYGTSNVGQFPCVPADGAVHLLTVCYDGTQTGNANRLRARFDGVDQTLSFSGTIPASLATSPGQTLFERSNLAGTLFPPGDHYEDTLYSPCLTDAQRGVLETYMRGRWGTP